MLWLRTHLSHCCCRETIRQALLRLKMSWKKAKKLLSKADPVKRAAFVEQIQTLLKQANNDELLLVYIDEAHIHQDVEPGYGWSRRGERFWVGSSSPGLSAKASFYGIYVYNEGQVKIWPYDRANSILTTNVLERLRLAHPERRMVLVWDGAGYHRGKLVKQTAERLKIELVPLPGYSPDFMPVEALWRWVRQLCTSERCHASRDDLLNVVADFEACINQDPCALADRLWVKDHLNPEEEALRLAA
jgi:transposase